MEDRDLRGEIARDLMHHPEHMCSLRTNSCANVSRAQIAEAAAIEGKKEVSRMAPDICTPFSFGA